MNTPLNVLVALGIAAGLMLVVGGVVIYARRRFRNAAATATELDDFALDFARRTSLLLFLPVALYLGSRDLVLSPDQLSAARTTVRLVLIGQAALWGAGVVDFFVRRYHRLRLETDPSAVTTVLAFRFATLIVVWSIAVLVALDNLGIDVTALVTGLGVGGVAVALATQNILGDLFASLSIVVDKPFVVGDFIRVGEEMGTVERIGLKTTRVRSLSGELLVFSNGDLLKSRIRNYKRMDERRAVFRLGVLYQTEPAKLRWIPATIRSIIESRSPVRFDRGHFASFGDSSYDFEFVYYVLSPDYNLYMDIQEEINLSIVEAFAKEGIEFAYPTRTIILENTSPAGETAHSLRSDS